MLHAESDVVTVRAVFIVDDKGIIRTILYYPLNMGRLIDEILRIVKGLQLVDRYKRALPANLLNNELIGDAVIVPPASTIYEAEDRLKKYKCFDWWFCCEEGKVPKEVDLVRSFLERASKP